MTRVPTEEKQQIGRNIRRLRIEKRLTQTELSYQIDAPGNGSVAAWEAGYNMPNLIYAARLCKALGCEIEDLVRGGGTVRTDEHGMPLPHETNPLPWKIDEVDEFDLCDSTGNLVVFQVSTTDDTEFIVHAANRIIECRDIVRRLAENEEKTLDQWVSLYEDAKELWEKMKGAGDA